MHCHSYKGQKRGFDPTPNQDNFTIVEFETGTIVLVRMLTESVRRSVCERRFLSAFQGIFFLLNLPPRAATVSLALLRGQLAIVMLLATGLPLRCPSYPSALRLVS